MAEYPLEMTGIPLPGLEHMTNLLNLGFGIMNMSGYILKARQQTIYGIGQPTWDGFGRAMKFTLLSLAKMEIHGFGMLLVHRTHDGFMILEQINGLM